MKKITKLIIVLTMFITLGLPNLSTSQAASTSISGFTAAYYSYNDILVSWSKTKYNCYYQVYRATSKSGKYSKIATTKNGSYKDKNVKRNYYYKVRMYKGGKKYSFTTAKKALYEEYAKLYTSYKKHKITFTKLENARDLGGYTGYEGKKVVSKKLIRSARLYKISSSDIKKLKNTYHLSKIIDLRTADERKQYKDVSVSGATNILLPVMETTYDYSLHKITSTSYTRMCTYAKYKDFQNYRRTVFHQLFTGDYAKKEYKKVFDEILKSKGKTVLFHCTHGKDRTGVASALLLATLGVSDEDILDDINYTNTYYLYDLAYSNAKACKMKLTDVQIKTVNAYYGVYSEDFTAELNAINEQYGSLEEYVKEEIGISEEEINLLRSYYLL